MAGRILVVDDSAEVVDFFRFALTPLGHQVSGAYDGEEGLQRFADELPDLVFLDLLMPRRDGLDACRRMRECEQGLLTPIVLMTGVYRGWSKIDVMREHGALDFLVKPLRLDKITALVDFALGDRSSEDAAAIADPVLDELDLAPGSEGVEAIDDGAIPRLLARAEEEAVTGYLAAASGRTRKVLALVGGRIVGCRSTLSADCLDRMLLALRRMTPAEHGAIRAQLAGATDDLLARLEGLGLVAGKAREELLRFTVMTVAQSLLGWRRGTAVLRPGPVLPHTACADGIAPSRVLLRALRRDPQLCDRVGREPLHDDAILVAREAVSVGAGDLTRGEREVLGLVDGRRTLLEMGRVTALAQIPLEETLAVLAGAGLVRPLGVRDVCIETGEIPLRELEASGEAVAGSLAATPFAEVLGHLLASRATGLLTVDGAARRVIAVAQGEVTYARSTDPSDRLGQILLSRREVSSEALERALSEQRDHRPDRRLGALLVEAGVLSLRGLQEAVRHQILRIVRTTFAWRDGTFAFAPTSQGLGVPLHLGLDRLALLRLGVATVNEEVLAARFEGAASCRLVLRREPDDLVIEGYEADLVRLAREGGPLAPLLRHGVPVARALETLIAVGLVALEETESSGEEVSTAAIEAAEDLHEPELVVEMREDDDDDRRVLPAPTRAVPGADLAAVLAELARECRDGVRELRAQFETTLRLAERVAALEAENRRLAEQARSAPAPEAPPSRSRAKAPASRSHAPSARKAKASEPEPATVG